MSRCFPSHDETYINAYPIYTLKVIVWMIYFYLRFKAFLNNELYDFQLVSYIDTSILYGSISY